MQHPVHQELKALLTRYLNKYQNIYGELPNVRFDPPWPSECLQANEVSNAEKQLWKPAERNHTFLFASLEEGLGFSFPEGLKIFYGTFWSNGLCVDYGDDSFELIQVWNEEDEENLRNNMLGHCYARLKARVPLSYFLGSSGNEILSLCHETGNVQLEHPAKRAHRTIAPDLESFLRDCTPNLKDYDS